MQKLKRSSNRTYILIAIMIIAINCAALIGVLSAKYIKDYYPVGTLKLSVELDEEVELFEHKAVRQTDGDGSYYLADEFTDSKVFTNTYVVMPGVDIPKDPQFYFQKKSAVPIYLYVEIDTVIESADPDMVIPDTITYELTENWDLLEGVTGPNGGAVYVYKYTKDGEEKNIVDSTVFSADKYVSIIKNNTIKVSDSAGPGAAFRMDVYGYLAQVIKIKDSSNNIKDAETTFKDEFIKP